MAATRTQIYLTEEQRRRIETVMRRDGTTLAAVVRAALDEYLDHQRTDEAAALAATFGSCPDIDVPPRDEWDDRPSV